MSEEEKKVDPSAEAQDSAPAPAPEEKEVKEEDPSAKAQDTSSGEEVEVPKEFKALVEGIEKMSVMELNSLVKLLEKKFGVSAQAVAVASGGSDDGGDEEQDSFTVELKSVGDSKIGVIKAIKSSLGLGLKEAKDLVDGAPSVLKEGVSKAEAEEMKKAIEEAGGTAELK